MNEKITETLKRLVAATSKESSVTKNESEGGDDFRATLGDPNCPHCKGSGYLRKDLPLGHPDFGRIEICTCRQADIQSLIRERLFSISHLDELKDLTFETFNPRGRVGLGQRQQESIERAFNQARAFTETLAGWLLIQGGYGSGKTHLAAAIANECVSRGVPTLFLTVPDLLDTLRFTYDAEDVTFEERFDQIRNATLLVLDDFGTQSATAWAQEKLFQILNYRYINHLPLVITTNLSLEELEGRMRSRLSDPDLVAHVHIHAPDYRRPAEDTGGYELSSLHNHSDQTFGTFSDRRGEKLQSVDAKTLEEAFQAAREFAEEPAGWLIMMGPYGSGKTHLAAAIANYRASQGYPVMFVVIPDLLDHLRATFNPASSVSYDRRFEEIRSAPLLVLDDLGTQAMTPWVREKLYQLFNHRYNAALPTVITSADREAEIDSRLYARMLDRRLCKVKKITAPAYRGRGTRRQSKR
jgi:DNA replication protein DnaC